MDAHTSYVQAVINQFSKLTNPIWFIERQANRYNLFCELYKRVGYYKGELDFATWRARTITAWEIQDKLLPGSCTGSYYQGGIISSLGTLPISHKVMYGHSLCMLKTLPAALTSVPQGLYSTQWLQKLADVEYYAGAHKISSNFTSQFYHDGQTQLYNNEQLIIYSCAINANFIWPSIYKNLYTITDYNSEFTSLPYSISRFLNLFTESHPIWQTYHRIRKYAIIHKHSHAIKAILILHDAPNFFTAINIFQYCWVIVPDGENEALAVCSFLKTDPAFANRHIELIVNDGSHIATNIERGHVEPRCWVFTPKKMVKTVIAGFLTAISQILTKYPQEQLQAVANELMTDTI